MPVRGINKKKKTNRKAYHKIVSVFTGYVMIGISYMLKIRKDRLRKKKDRYYFMTDNLSLFNASVGLGNKHL